MKKKRNSLKYFATGATIILLLLAFSPVVYGEQIVEAADTIDNQTASFNDDLIEKRLLILAEDINEFFLELGSDLNGIINMVGMSYEDLEPRISSIDPNNPEPDIHLILDDMHPEDGLIQLLSSMEMDELTNMLEMIDDMNIDDIISGQTYPSSSNYEPLMLEIYNGFKKSGFSEDFQISEDLEKQIHEMSEGNEDNEDILILEPGFYYYWLLRLFDILDDITLQEILIVLLALIACILTIIALAIGACLAATVLLIIAAVLGFFAVLLATVWDEIVALYEFLVDLAQQLGITIAQLMAKIFDLIAQGLTLAEALYQIIMAHAAYLYITSKWAFYQFLLWLYNKWQEFEDYLEWMAYIMWLILQELIRKYWFLPSWLSPYWIRPFLPPDFPPNVTPEENPEVDPETDPDEDPWWVPWLTDPWKFIHPDFEKNPWLYDMTSE